MTVSRPDLLIEHWLPLAEVGVECRRERSTGQQPPDKRLHVWWARRPLIACRAAVLGSLLPQWQEDWPADLKKQFPTEKSYHEWFKRLLGIHGDPVAANKLVDYARNKGIRVPNPYTYPRAFSINPDLEELHLMLNLLEFTLGLRTIRVSDTMAGGGSIPLEALRCGLNTYVNEINPVATIIIKGTLEYPAKFGKRFADEINKWGMKINDSVRGTVMILLRIIAVARCFL